MSWKFRAQLFVGVIVLIIVAWIGFTTINYLRFTEGGQELCEGTFLAPAGIGCQGIKECTIKEDCIIVYSNCYCTVANKEFKNDLEFLDENIFCIFSACEAEENQIDCINGRCVS